MKEMAKWSDIYESLGHHAFAIITNDEIRNNVHGVKTHSGKKWHIRLKRLNEQKWKTSWIAGWRIWGSFHNKDLFKNNRCRLTGINLTLLR